MSRSRPRTNTVAVFHALRPHSAMSPLPIDETSIASQQSNEVDWSQLLVASIIPLVLPPGELTNPCLSVLVTEIFSEMIVRNAVLGKTCEAWMIWEGVTKLIYSLRPKRETSKHSEPSPASRLEQFGLLSGLEAVRADATGNIRNETVARQVTIAFWTTLQFGIVAWTLLRAFVIAFMQASTLPSRPGRNFKRGSCPDENEGVDEALHSPRPVLDMKIWSCLGRLASLHKRMPWLSGWLSMMQWYSIRTGVCSANSAIDR